MRTQLEDMQRRMEQGSQERQGEMLEEVLKEVLERRFPYDRFEDVAKGRRGADILQVVNGLQVRLAGRWFGSLRILRSSARVGLGSLRRIRRMRGLVGPFGLVGHVVAWGHGPRCLSG
jgi:hypothetical protein